MHCGQAELSNSTTFRYFDCGGRFGVEGDPPRTPEAGGLRRAVCDRLRSAKPMFNRHGRFPNDTATPALTCPPTPTPHLSVFARL